ncbi:MAG: hypothetical protein ACLR7U_07255 [Ruthenibacterium lactatiformans]
MQKRSSESRKIALSGVFGSLAAVLMLMGGILPLATYVAPALAGILIVPVAIEFGIKTGYVLYAAIGLLSLFVVPDKEMSLIFVFFLGFYPLLKASIERMRSRAAQWAVKLAVFNACIVGMYGIILFLFPIGAVVEEFESMGIPFTGLLLLMGNVTFVIYDVAVARIIGLYCARFRARLMKCTEPRAPAYNTGRFDIPCSYEAPGPLQQRAEALSFPMVCPPPRRVTRMEITRFRQCAEAGGIERFGGCSHGRGSGRPTPCGQNTAATPKQRRMAHRDFTHKILRPRAAGGVFLRAVQYAARTDVIRPRQPPGAAAVRLSLRLCRSLSGAAQNT